MWNIKFSKVVFIILVTVILFAGLLTVLAATNIVPVSYLTDQTRSITLSELVPPECASIRYTLEDIVECSGGNCSSHGNRNELILGTSGNDIIDGGNGDDCIVGGGGDDQLYGNNGNDVLVGGPGSDYLSGDGRNKDTDKCIDDPATTVFDSSCEEFTP
jgi:Ca2+-binding RTX toxin-like protein